MSTESAEDIGPQEEPLRKEDAAHQRAAVIVSDAKHRALAITNAAKRDADQLLAAAQREVETATSRTAKRIRRQEMKREARARAKAGQPTGVERTKKMTSAMLRSIVVVGPITAPMAVAWTGQASFAETVLAWPFLASLLYAAAYELTTTFTGWMYHEAQRAGDSGTLYRIMTWVFALGAAAQQYWHNAGPGLAPTPRAVTYATMSVVGMVLWELYARLIHRQHARATGRASQARPRIELVRWFRYPVHAFTAWSIAISNPDLVTLEAAWTAAGRRLADRRAVRSGLALHRIVVPRVRTTDHGPASVPMVRVTLDRVPLVPMDRTVLDRPALPPVQDHGPQDQQTTVPALARRTAPALDQQPNTVHATVPTGQDQRTTSPDQTNGAAGQAAADHTDQIVIRSEADLREVEVRALDQLRTNRDPINRRSVAKAVRDIGGTVNNKRAGAIAAWAKGGPDLHVVQPDRTDQTA